MSSQSPAAAAASAERQPASDVGEGWTSIEVTRKGGKTAGTKDRYWYSPSGKKFRSKAEIGRFKDALATLVGADDEGDEDKAWKLFKGGAKSNPSSSAKAKSASTGAKKKIPASASSSSSKKKKKATPTTSAKKKAAVSDKNIAAAAATSSTANADSSSDDDDFVKPAKGKKQKAAGAKGQIGIAQAFAAGAAAVSRKRRPAAESDDNGEEKKEDEDDMAAAVTASSVAAGGAKKKSKKMVARKSQKPGRPATKKVEARDKEMADTESNGEKEKEVARVAAKAAAPKGSRGGKKRKKDEASHDEESEGEQKMRTPKGGKKKGRATGKKKKAKKTVDFARNLNEMEYDDMDVVDEEEEPTPPPTATSRSGRVRKKVNYAVDYSDGDLMASSEEEKFDSSDDDFEKKPQAKGGRKKTCGRKKKRATPPSSDEESEVSSIASEESEEISDDAFGEDDDDDDMDLEEEEKPKKKRGGGGKKKAAAAKPSKSGSTSASKSVEGGKKSMADSFKPTNAPPYFRDAQDAIAREHECLDPCGTEATDDIIDGLVGKQVDKIGALLSRALKSKRCDLGSAACPLKLGTACSGTDAPALALTLVQEQMKLRNLLPDSNCDRKVGPSANDSDKLLNVDHKFSCEVEPFKQAYLGRNFDSTLYPDIGKLCDDPPLDVYGRPQEIPPFNLFVAGTSCKNFSMLRHKTRIDIEAKGCSGETFLAAVELLFKMKPAYCIFENVTGAPWEKMKEYITGRIKLSNCGSDKNIGEVKSAEKKMELTFVLGEDGAIMVDKVPGCYGVRCDSIVEGFIKGETRTIKPIDFPSTSKCQKERKCTLTELMKHNGISKANDTLVFETGVTYCAHYMKVDTKDYGLPQTRNRTYMFVWQPDNEDVEDDLGEYWEAIVSFLQSPVRHSLEAFILEPDHDIIRVFREALNGPAGRTSKRAAFLEPDFWTSTSANLKYSTITRERSGIDEMARTVTSWGPYGEKQCPPHYWMEYLNVTTQRQLDVIEIMHASAARDAELHDSSFSSFFWNISQNAGKEKHRTAKCGIAGCVTPGGNVFLPHQGRPILGSEKLLLQGIPYFRLLLNNETEVQLGDLAGNAMSLTVVCATMLGALTCKQLRTECLEAENDVDPMKLLTKTASLPTKALQEHLDADIALNIAETHRQSPIPCISSVFKQLAPLAREAVEASILCTCESSGRNSSTCEFVQCRRCGVSCCRDCLHSTAGYQLKSHDTESITVGDRTQGAFKAKLQNIVPTSIIFDEAGIKELSTDHRAQDLDKFVFNLHRIQRGRRTWRIVYYAKADAGTGEPIAQFVVSVGEVAAKGVDDGIQLGVNGTLTSFLPAKLPPLVYGPLSPCAKVRVLMGSEDGELVWSQKMKTKTTDLVVEGAGESPSFRAETGINDDAPAALVATSKTKYYQKIIATAKQRGEERRWFYPDNWKVWPKKIIISGGSSDAATVHGVFVRSDCRQTTNQSALWVREADGLKPTLYLLMQPFVSRNGSDFAVISSSISHDDPTAVLATFPFKWQPCDALEPRLHKVKGVKLSMWAPLSLKCSVPKSSIKVNSPADEVDTLAEVSGLTELDVSMLGRNDMVTSNSTDILSLNVTRGQQAQQTVRVFNSLCITPILQHAARKNLRYDLGPDAAWIEFVPSAGDKLIGCDEAIVPTRPAEVWSYDTEREEWIRSFGPGASREYYTALKSSPSTFEMLLNIKGKKLTIKCDPRVAAHRAAFSLIEGRANNRSDLSHEVSVQYRLSDAACQTDPVLDPFHVSNCESLEPTSVRLQEPYELYERQMKVVTKMSAIEDGRTKFEEIEMFDEPMPGSSGWSLVAKATRTKGIRGGVIADAIGAGKTVIGIALILRKIEESRAARELPMQSSATLVPMPPGLLDQWKGEINRFAPHLRTVCVYDLSSLKKLTVKDICNADVVLVPIDILESNTTYLQHVLKMAGEKSTTAPKLPKGAGQTEVSEANGVWIPGSSQDPYAGGKGNQAYRNESAHYTYVYNTAIQKLRKKTFKPTDKGVPLEYFVWHRIIVDEIHESLCTTKGEIAAAKEAASEGDGAGFFKEKNRRAGRELLGITEKNVDNRPLRFRSAMFGLTGTPLLDNCDRVIELANLMGGSYIIGLSSHWRKLERESMRDIFLHNYLEPRQSREVRRNVYSYCQKYLSTACCRNKTGEEMSGIALVTHRHAVNMNAEEKKAYLGSMSGIRVAERSLAIKPEEFDVDAGHDISKFLRQNAKLACRGKALVDICKNVLSQQGCENTKIVVFADGRIGAQVAAREYLCAEPGLGCTWLDTSDSVEEKNKKISWYQTADVTAEDRARPRVLLLNFEHAAGLNLQTECNHLIFFSPLYVGQGGTSGDAVTDASTELQAIGRVHRPGQPKTQVNVFRIEVRGPDDEECLDGQLIRRNTDEETVSMATNAAD